MSDILCILTAHRLFKYAFNYLIYVLQINQNTNLVILANRKCSSFFALMKSILAKLNVIIEIIFLEEYLNKNKYKYIYEMNKTINNELECMCLFTFYSFTYIYNISKIYM